ncbi:MAG TPA: TIGR00153 family protein [Desulfobacteraceae bacterium]|jgi:uncharacterized protein|nr:TIGR00153 family protein [Desulfobacteraceae bacterium]
MFLEKLFSHGKKEREVINDISRHIELLSTACRTFRHGLEKRDRNLMQEVGTLERYGDAVRREVISHIYEGAFLPYLRTDLCAFVEIVDQVFEMLKDIATLYLHLSLPEKIERQCCMVALLNQRISEMLLLTFKAMSNGEDIREKTLAVRIYEKKIDDIKYDLLKTLQAVPIDNFWQGRMLADFVSGLTKISDIIEDATDSLQIINVMTR